MVVKTSVCAFSEQRIYPGFGKHVITRDGRLLHLASSKNLALWKRKVKGQDVRWTIIWRRINKKLKTDEQSKRKKRRNKRIVRDIQGMAREEIRRRQGETKEEKAAQNERAIREIKERKARLANLKKGTQKTTAQQKPQNKRKGK